VIALNRIAFGPRPGDPLNSVEAFQALGATEEARLEAYVDQQTDPASLDDSDCDTRVAAANLPTLTKSLTQLWADHYINSGGSSTVRVQPAQETRTATLIRAVYSRRQLAQVLADFWHNHFNVYAWDYQYASATWAHYDRDVIRAHLLGNFRQMLEAVATSPAMLYYLDNYINQRSGPNENYARELLELHTLGAENYLGVADPDSVPRDGNGISIAYVDNDVFEATRCFTGWRVNNGASGAQSNDGTFFYYDAWHDRFNKFVLGKRLPADQPSMKDGRDVLDLVAYHPGTARFICRKLCRRFIGDNPPEAVVNAAATVFLDNKDAPDQLKRVVRTILLSPEFRTTWGQKIKRPFEAIVSALRATNAQVTFPDSSALNSFFWNYDQIGQPLFARRSPDGYPDVIAGWSNTVSILQRWRMINSLIEGSFASTTIDVLAQTPSEYRSPNELVDFWVNRVLGRPMHPTASRDVLVEFIAQGRNPDYDLTDSQIAERLKRMVALILMSPDFQLR